MIAFMTKTLSSINEDLREGKTVLVAAAPAYGAAGQPEAEEPGAQVHAVTTATFESSLHRIPCPLPAKSEDSD
jgi:uncharacterized protein (DUF39 family)